MQPPERAADELSRTKLLDGWEQLEALTARWAPGVLAEVGTGAWRTCTGDRTAAVGPQARTVGGRPAWVLRRG